MRAPRTLLRPALSGTLASSSSSRRSTQTLAHHGLASIPCSFYRGGTSKGLLWSASTLSRFPASLRDRIICSAMGSPDPDRRQIDGLGGGLSSLSKTAVVSAPSRHLSEEVNRRGEAWRWKGDLADWIDDEARAAAGGAEGWDVVYRFGQVPIEEGTDVDWGSTCGNLVSAVALFALQEGVVTQHQIRRHAEAIFPSSRQRVRPGDTMLFPVRILAAASGNVVTANVPVTAVAGPDATQGTGPTWHPDVLGETTISGVPGSAPGILISTPLNTSTLLPTGRSLDTLTLDRHSFPVTIIDAGLPTIFLPSSAIPRSVLEVDKFPSLTPSELDANRPLMTLLERLRQATSTLSPALQRAMSPSAPKICIVHPSHPSGYTTTGGTKLPGEEMHLLIRAISVGNVHRTVPATCLSALACARAFADSTVETTLRASSVAFSPRDGTQQEQEDVRTIVVGQPAGLSSASVRLKSTVEGSQRPESIVYYRTARRIVRGSIDVPLDWMTGL